MTRVFIPKDRENQSCPSYAMTN